MLHMLCTKVCFDNISRERRYRAVLDEVLRLNMNAGRFSGRILTLRTDSTAIREEGKPGKINTFLLRCGQRDGISFADEAAQRSRLV
jgi:hypothetical protein